MSDVGDGLRARIRDGVVAAGRGLVLYGVSQLGLVFGVLLIALVGSLWWVFLVPAMVVLVRWLANLSRHLAGAWSGVEIPVPYRTDPPREPGFRGFWQRLGWILTDPATWRDLLWLLLAPISTGVLAVLPAGFIVFGGFGLAQPAFWQRLPREVWDDRYAWIHVTSPSAAWSAVSLGAVFVVVGLAIGPRMLLAHAQATRLLLAPTAAARLGSRVQHLTETRSDAMNAQAAEVRRIERDLHDGAQARLVAMGMTLSAAEHLLETDPKASRALLNEAREASAKALDELRDLVRGIHPPVLADRGLGEAVRALALESGLRVTVAIDLPGRPAPAVESAVYFAISEILSNAAKHAGAERVLLDLRHRGGVLTVVITDNGRGGAEIGRGTGLRGIQRRLASFDGILAIDSPKGGPTTVTMELPCALSSPKTTLCSATD